MDNKFNMIKNKCLKSTEKNAVKLAINIMKEDYISIHGSEHHILDGACLMAAMHNCGYEFSLENALNEMIERGKNMPGATCGMWGMCGSAASIGAALAIIHKTGPLSNNQYYKDNLNCVSKALAKIAEVGGPRCCKRNAFLSLQSAIDFINVNYDIKLEKSDIVCTFSNENKQCIGQKCPFHKD